MNVLGLSYNYHDAAACVVRDGVAVAAAEEERFSRIKHDSRFPRQAVAFCLRTAGLTSRDLDAVAFYEKPARKLERILQVGKRHAPASAANVVAQFSSHIAGGFDVEAQLREQMGFEGDVYFCAHHLSHAASAFYASPYEAAAILTVDGVGEWATVAQFRGRGRVIEKRREIRYPHSIGLLYSTLTAFLGFRANDDEYKVMGLAAYGKPRFRAQFEELVTLHRDGSFSLALPYFAFMYARERMHSPLLESLLGPPRAPHESVSERHRDIAATLQAMTEDILVALARACRDDGARHLCLAGGVAQNCVANTKILQRAGYSGLFIQPAPGDSGAAMGAALWASHQVLGQARSPARHQTCLGPEFGEAEMLAALQASGVAFRRLPEAERCRQVAALIAQDFIIGWFQGRMEFGPRALGARSILANPRNPHMQDILNARVKFREEFRPFAPAVTAEAAPRYFDLAGESRFMLLTPQVMPDRAAEIPAVTHVDGTARVQTVSRADNPLFHQLITAFGEISGTPILVNTSFNVRGEPIVCTPEDAVRCFLATDIDFLAIGPFLASKVPLGG